MTEALKSPGEPLTAEEEEDPLLDECVRDALGPYFGFLSPEEVADHEKLLHVFIKTHPAASPLYERLRKRPVKTATGEAARDGVPVEDEPAQADGTTGRAR